MPKVHRGVWNKSATGSHEVRGKKLGIIGYGHIGSQLSIIAESLGMDVHFYDIENKLPLGNAKQVRSLEELLSFLRCGFITCARTAIYQKL